MEFKSQVALVTGAGSGIGKAVALKLAGKGAKVGVLGRTKSEIDATVREIAAAGGEALPLEADVSLESQMRAAIDLLTEKFGRLDIVVANAGINGVWAPIDDLKPEEFDK